jgi:hypothetical protein
MSRVQSPKPSNRARFARWLAHRIAGRDLLASVTAQVDDSAGWFAFQGGPNDRNTAEMQEQYTDALTAWRKNPMAKWIVDTITDYCLGDGMRPEAGGDIGRFLDRWWDHPKNHLALRMPELTDELSRAGDLFLTLHRNPEDGLSYIRPVPKDRIMAIDTLPNDWETEIAFYETQQAGPPKIWLSPAHPDAGSAGAVMLHYSVNRPVGALLGESDLGTMIPWLLRYSRMLEDRVRLHWAARAFLWIVTVPTAKVREKQAQYGTAPDSGSVIVKDESEDWKAVNPDLKGMDAQFDLRAVRMMIDAGSSLPPHWRGEPHNISLATSRSMDRSAARHLRRRQLYIRTMIVDLAHNAYSRAYEIGKARAKPNRDAITVETTDIDRQDNQELAAAARDVANALAILGGQLPGRSNRLQKLFLRLVLRFAGETPPDEDLDAIMAEIAANPLPEAAQSGSQSALTGEREQADEDEGK